MKKDKKAFEDDGRTIANMNIEGMPWYKPSTGSGRSTDGDEPIEQLSKEGQRAMTGGVLLAALLIGAVYIAGLLLFILFCVHVWFK